MIDRNQTVRYYLWNIETNDVEAWCDSKTNLIPAGLSQLALDTNQSNGYVTHVVATPEEYETVKARAIQ